MKKPNLSKFVRGVQTYATKHSPDILMGIGIAGMLTATVLAVKATPKALDLIEEEKEKNNTDELSAMDMVRVAWKPYAMATITMVSSTICLVGARNINSKRIASIATAYKISETALAEYKDQVIKTIGDKKEQHIKDEIAKQRIQRDPISKTKEVIITEKGNTLCYDTISGRYFKSDMDIISKAQNLINRTMTYDMYVSLNEFYVEIGLAPIEFGNLLGWNIDDGLLNIEFSSQLADDGTPCLVMGFGVAPKYDFNKLY